MVTIEKPQRSDYREIAELVNTADKIFLDIYSREEAKEMGVSTESEKSLIEGETTREYLILRENNKIAAFTSFRLKNEQTVWISSLYVHPVFQRKGLGALLLREIEKYAQLKKAKVVVAETDKLADWAWQFYQANGYAIISNNEFRKYPFDQVLDKEPVRNRHIIGKIIE